MVSGHQHFAEPGGVENSNGICGCWEDALRDRHDRLLLESRRNILENGQGVCSDFPAALGVLCVFVLLYKDKARRS